MTKKTKHQQVFNPKARQFVIQQKSSAIGNITTSSQQWGRWWPVFPWGGGAAQHLAMGECFSPSCAALYLVHSRLLAELSAPDKPALCCLPIHLHDKKTSHLQDVIVATNLPGTRPLLPVAVVVKFVVTGKRNEDAKACAQRVKDLGGSINPNLGEKTQIQPIYTKWTHGGTTARFGCDSLSLCSCITLLFFFRNYAWFKSHHGVCLSSQ